MSQDQADAVDAPPSKEKPITDKKLDYFLKNGFRHIFHVLDFDKQGVVNKSSLQVICANICRVLDILYMREHLESFKGEISRLDEDGFLEYVCHLVGKAIGVYLTYLFRLHLKVLIKLGSIIYPNHLCSKYVVEVRTKSICLFVRQWTGIPASFSY